MSWATAIGWTIALLAFWIEPAPATAQEICIDPQDLTRLYQPGEPGPCLSPAPTTSEVGRPPDDTALHLAWCAGLHDAAVLLEPQIGDDPSIVSGEAFFSVAKGQRERPGLGDLEAARAEGRDWLLADDMDESYSLGSLVPHSFIVCGQAYRFAKGEH
ncbi:hypothetical protein [Tabrizicola sp.]|uniref:hypothetical protein n=1 Tax=Tabrizicola sp. TaxID=2005166 RepID=UPI003F2E023C